MNLAAILAVYFLSLGWQPSAVTLSNRSAPQRQENAAPPQSQAPPAQSPESTQPAPSPTSQQNSPSPAKPPVANPRHHKKAIRSDCSTSPTALNPAVAGSTGATNTQGTGSTDSGSTDVAPANPASANAGAAASPCPPRKKVVRNGGSPEPAVKLTGGTPAEQALQQRSTDQLTAATEENLKQIAGRQLSPSQQDMVSHIKQFMEQSKAAVAAGDLERGRDLAMKAHLLSDELVKP
jgi:hypothetical protein